MRPKSIIWGQMGGNGCGKRMEKGLSDRLVEGTLKFGRSCLMVWSCMLWDGVGYACKIDRKMDADLYVSILNDDLQASLYFYGKTTADIIFQQDNDLKRISRKAKSCSQDHDFEVLLWPAQSPDLNHIEHLWSYLKRKLAEYERPPDGILELWERVQVEWDKID